MSTSPEIALIGGGTGSHTLLSELKNFTPNISAIVNMSDDGGSTGELREEFGGMPPGDVRQCLVALSNVPHARDIFDFRFPESKGALAGHSLGNLILTGLELQQGNFDAGLKMASRLLQITGKVIPVTHDIHDLIMLDGEELVRGEYSIGHRTFNSKSVRISHDPPATVSPEAEDAIQKADLVVIAPGNLYGSILPALAVNGMDEAFMMAKGKKVLVSNLVTQKGQTDGWHVVDYVREVEEYVGSDQIDVVLYNNDFPSKDSLEGYEAEGSYPVSTDREGFKNISAKPVAASLLSKKIFKQKAGDKIKRQLIKHDAEQVGRELMKIYFD